MPHIAIISASVRIGRVSHRVAQYFDQYIASHNLGTAEILDLKEYNFPIFEERLHLQPEPSAKALDLPKNKKCRRRDYRHARI